ncbi:KxYKxGKxW signal peptide domain-containing protein, partial [Limosilactobacillus caviae]|uniref:KxYKxGKxW signal peptide domain-containing protein n=1 Tax=Limosilactobacillus caviae TaxID=1769424 RepID=UPI003D24EA42
MEIKKHFKLYKSGKQWVTAAVATVALSTGMILGGVAHADTAAAADTQPAVTQPANDSQTKTSQDNNQEQTTPKNVVPDLSQQTLKAANTTALPVNTRSVDEKAPQQDQNYDHNDKGSYGAFDSVAVNNNQLHVTGWQATNQAAQYGN